MIFKNFVSNNFAYLIKETLDRGLVTLVILDRIMTAFAIYYGQCHKNHLKTFEE